MELSFRAKCPPGALQVRQLITNDGTPTSIPDLRDPFYASTIPQVYALAVTTCLTYTLFIMLIITPRSFLINDAVFLGRRGFMNGPSGISIGGRPWLQKVAALTVAVSLTIATVDTFRVTEEQYNNGFNDAKQVQDRVTDGMELKVIRVISGFFLWLAQAQTLIRLFPRQREKIIIKWTAFALITLDVTFSILNNFMYNGSPRPRTFVDAVPALAYLFELALSLLYCAWVMYYAITKKGYAFYHPKMSNISLVALLSLVSIMVPVVFFILDVSKPSLAGWGDYVRWVGAAAASVIVWEWVERIEALERIDKKDGVLGREVFDGDEMLDITPSFDSGRRPGQNPGGGDKKSSSAGSSGKSWPVISGIAKRFKPGAVIDMEANHQLDSKQPYILPFWPRRAATPISRTGTASAESTVYAIRYHPISEPTPPLSSDCTTFARNTNANPMHNNEAGSEETPGPGTPPRVTPVGGGDCELYTVIKQESAWEMLDRLNPLHRSLQGPPAEVSAHTPAERQPCRHIVKYGWDIRARLEDFAATQADILREKTRPKNNIEPFPVTVIPAPVRRRDFATTLQELEDSSKRTNALEYAGATIEPSPRNLPETQITPQRSKSTSSTESAARSCMQGDTNGNEETTRPSRSSSMRSSNLDEIGPAIASAPPRWFPGDEI